MKRRNFFATMVTGLCSVLGCRTARTEVKNDGGTAVPWYNRKRGRWCLGDWHTGFIGQVVEIHNDECGYSQAIEVEMWGQHHDPAVSREVPNMRLFTEVPVGFAVAGGIETGRWVVVRPWQTLERREMRYVLAGILSSHHGLEPGMVLEGNRESEDLETKRWFTPPRRQSDVLALLRLKFEGRERAAGRIIG